LMNMLSMLSDLLRFALAVLELVEYIKNQTKGNIFKGSLVTQEY